MPTRAASPSSSASSESPSSSSSSSAERGVDISGYRLVAVMAFVVFTFGLFLYLQHDVLISAEESLELHSPPTIQNFVRHEARDPVIGASALSQRTPVARAGAPAAAAGGGTAVAGRAIDGGFVPRRFRSPAAAEMAARADHGSLSDGGGSRSNERAGGGEGKGKSSVSGYIEIDLVRDEGADVGNIDQATAEDCADKCNANPQCHSFSYRHVSAP
jgi:hypothetical protein